MFSEGLGLGTVINLHSYREYNLRFLNMLQYEHLVGPNDRSLWTSLLPKHLEKCEALHIIMDKIPGRKDKTSDSAGQVPKS